MLAAHGTALELGEQHEVNLAGEYWGDPDTSSYRYEPECAFMKPATDIVLLGHGYSTGSRAAEVSVGLSVGPIQKAVLVIGDRYWEGGLAGSIRMSSPQPFDRIPLVYEHAFGGWDRSDPEQEACEHRNPIGKGFRVRWDGKERIALPNIEDPRHRIQALSDRPTPAGFGFLSPHWQPRASSGGTYDAAWMSRRSPLLPMDFNRRYFNAASPGLVAPGYLRGDEPVHVKNASVRGPLTFALPRVPPPQVTVTVRNRGIEQLTTALDTIIIDTDQDLVSLIWRAHVRVLEIPRSVTAVTVQSERTAITWT